MSRRMNDGDMTGMKQDRYRNSRFEFQEERPENMGGSTSRDANTLGGPYQENRGRRGDADWKHSREENPFENGSLQNWNHRQGWDQYYEHKRNRHGGALSTGQSHFGRGPKGYARRDDSIFEDVCEALSLSADVDASDIEVTVKEGCVYLNGTVESRQMKRMAELEIENIGGVKDVQNLLRLRSLT